MLKKTNLEDEELIFFIKLNDDEAFDLLLERYQKHSKNLVRSILISFPNSGVGIEELANIALLSVTKALENYQEDKDFYNYWRSIATNDVFKQLKKDSYKGKSSTFAGISLDSVVSTSNGTACLSDVIGKEEPLLSQNYLLKSMIKVVKSDEVYLNSDEKEVFISYLKGHEMRKILKKYNISKSTFYRIRSRGKFLLSDFYEKTK